MSSEKPFSFFGITKVGEGAEKGEHEIPIEVKGTLLLAWLIDRKILKEGWNTALKSILATASKLPAASGNKNQPEVDLWFAEEQLQRLLQEEGRDTSKSLLRNYNDATIAAWDGVVKELNRDNLWMAQAAESLVQLVKYELPAMEARAKAQQRQIAELAKSQEEARKQGKAHLKSYQDKCKEMGVDPETEDVVAELLGLVSELPRLYAVVEECSQDPGVSSALELYREFTKYTLQIIDIAQVPPCCTTLEEVIASGVSILLEDFPDGDPLAAPQEEVIEVDWDPAAEEVDWDAGIEAVEQIEVMAEEPVDLTRKSRHTLLDDVVELCSFLRQRISESASKGNQTVSDITAAHGCPKVIRKAKVEELLQAVEKLRDALEAPRFVHLLQLKASRRYVERVAHELRKPLLASRKLEQSLGSLTAKQNELIAALESNRPTSVALKKRARALRDRIQDALQKIYNGTKVILTGAVQQI